MLHVWYKLHQPEFNPVVRQLIKRQSHPLSFQSDISEIWTILEVLSQYSREYWVLWCWVRVRLLMFPVVWVRVRVLKLGTRVLRVRVPSTQAPTLVPATGLGYSYSISCTRTVLMKTKVIVLVLVLVDKYSGTRTSTGTSTDILWYISCKGENHHTCEINS